MPKTRRGRKKKTRKSSVKTLKLQTKGQNKTDTFEKMEIKEFIDLISRRHNKHSDKKDEEADKAVKYYSNFNNWKYIKNNNSILDFKKHFMKHMFASSMKSKRTIISYKRKKPIKKLLEIYRKYFNKNNYEKTLQKTCDNSELFYNYFIENVISGLKVKTTDDKYGIVKNIYNDVDYFYDNYLNVENPDDNDLILKEVLERMNTDDKGNKIFISSMNRPYQIDDQLTSLERSFFSALNHIKPINKNDTKIEKENEILRKRSRKQDNGENENETSLGTPIDLPVTPELLEPNPLQDSIKDMVASSSNNSIKKTRKNSRRYMGKEQFKKTLEQLEKANSSSRKDARKND